MAFDTGYILDEGQVVVVVCFLVVIMGTFLWSPFFCSLFPFVIFFFLFSLPPLLPPPPFLPSLLPFLVLLFCPLLFSLCSLSFLIFNCISNPPIATGLLFTTSTT
ncbi:hypothetical protein K457DRAFT_400778 [Linnemannia elongata AG-77]|uniref:Uncharacterized protein n=1 Tax=Linnemannia elongata AG-77 TaxID=1314771 RepID=A0A197K2Y8_9FUNG|nr:hypothetical protein K457DRAFT_400778 [Linnemannia elongata AG-77]